MMYYFKSAGLGYAADGTPLPEMSINPLIKAFNAVGYDAMDRGQPRVQLRQGSLQHPGQASSPCCRPTSPTPANTAWRQMSRLSPTSRRRSARRIKVAILGIGNHRVPSYELPSNIPGLTFTNPIQAGRLRPDLQANNDVVIALTHIGFTDRPEERRSRHQRRHLLRGQVPASMPSSAGTATPTPRPALARTSSCPPSWLARK
jgi:hypothetical protein